MSDPSRTPFRFSDWPILAKVTASSLITLAALVTLSLIGWKTLHDQRDAILENYNQTLPVFDSAYKISHYVSQVEANLYRLATWSQMGVSGPEMRNVLKTIEYNLTRADHGIERLTAADMPGAAQLRMAYDAYRSTASQALLLLLKDPTLGAITVRGGREHYREVERLAAEVAVNTAVRFREGAVAASESLERRSGEFVLGSLLIAALAMVLSFVMARTILRPVSEIVAAIDRLQRGDLSGQIAGAQRGDEIGRIAQSVEKLQAVMEQNELLARDRARKQEALEFAATHDSLTGLANRPAFDDYLASRLADGRRRNRICFLLADLDGFKPINDAYGHGAGDAVLKTLAQRYRDLVREDDMVARLGGDEFGLVITLDHLQRDPTVIARRILEATALPIDHDGRELRIGVSVGVVLDRDVEGGQIELMAAADQALFLAKEQKRPWYVLYQPEMVLDRLGLEDREELERAIDANEFTLLYCPIVDLRTGSLHGIEARAVWSRPGAGVLQPDAYMPRIAYFGMRREFAMHIARRALNDMRDLLRQGLAPGQLSLNVDATMLATRSSFDDLLDLLAQYPEMHDRLTIEITDDALSGRGSAIIRDNVRTLAEKGVRISMDDFGAGHASFQHLREFEVDEVKIERSFVAGIGHQRSAAVIIEGFLSIAAGLGARGVAAGIETEQQRRFLLKRGCHFGQGPLLSGPLAIDRLIEYLHERAAEAKADPTAC